VSWAAIIAGALAIAAASLILLALGSGLAQEEACAGRREMDMRSLTMMFAGLMMTVAAIAKMAGCTPTTSESEGYARC
jgi:predicted permease